MNEKSFFARAVGRRGASWLIAVAIFSTAAGAAAQGFSDRNLSRVDQAQSSNQAPWGQSRNMGAISVAGEAAALGPLPVDQAFSAHVARGQEGDVVNLVPAAGYLIYRHTLELFDSSGAPIRAQWPDGKPHQDGEFGQVRVFDGPVRLVLPAADRVSELRMQGCQEDGICYPPMQATVGADGGALKWRHARGEALPGKTDVRLDDGGSSKAQDAGWLAGLMAGPAGLFGFLLVGLLMAFSPCLLPMLPVTLSLVAGRARSHRWSIAPVAWFAAAHGAVWAVGGFLAAGSGGVLLSARLQSPVMLAAGAALFGALGAWQMGWIQVSLPQWTGRAPKWREEGMGPMRAMTLGATSALVLGPCAAPILAGALLAVAQAGNPWMGAAGLGLMGIGMCVPMLAMAAGGSSVLERWRQASAWIAWLGASALWAVAAALAGRIVDPSMWPWLAAAWAGLSMAGLWSHAAPAGRARLGLAMVVGLVMITAAGSGLTGKGPWAAGQAQRMAMAQVRAQDIEKWVAGQGGQGVVWVVADWCSVCKQFDRQTLSDARVSGRLGGMNVARVDITKMGEAEVTLLQDLGLVGPPGVLFYDQGREIPAARLVGFEGPEDFLARLGRVGGGA